MKKLTVRGISTHEESKGEWKYGYLIEDEGISYIINSVMEANDEYITIGEWCSVEPETVGISTGLVDKNDQEIFEGDIIRYGTNVAEIKRHPTLGFYTVVDGREIFFGDEMSIDDFEEVAEEVSKTFEIIGNIYENPELLKN